MGEAFPELPRKQDDVIKALRREEERFSETVEQGMKLLEDAIAALDGDTIPGDTVFKLYDTFGFPIDLTRDIARERALTVDEAGFEQAMEAQRERARSAGSFSAKDGISAELIAELPRTEFLGYHHHETGRASVVAILVDGQPVESLQVGVEATIILDRTPFYAESGGQVGDTGLLESEGLRFQVEDTRKLAGVFHGHVGQLETGTLKVGQVLSARIDRARRADVVRHHSATHLLHAALRTVLGEHVQQKGSLVAPERLRFDFSHHEPVNDEELATIERMVNEQIQANAEAEAREMSFENAMAAGALAFFGDKYGDEVRVLKFGEFSIELCGGTHVRRVGDIGLFKIISETGISAGVRRIEAVAGQVAVDWIQNLDRSVRELSGRLKTSPDQLADRVDQLMDRSRQLEKELERLKGKLASAAGSDLASQAVEVAGIKLISAHLEGVDPNGLRETVDQLKNKLGSGIIVLGTRAGDGVRLVAGVTADLTGQVKAGELVNHVAAQVGGKGGGRPDFAQAGGTDPAGLPAALDSVAGWLEQRVSK
jgi:alanyl-tRNA synthetase